MTKKPFIAKRTYILTRRIFSPICVIESNAFELMKQYKIQNSLLTTT